MNPDNERKGVSTARSKQPGTNMGDGKWAIGGGIYVKVGIKTTRIVEPRPNNDKSYLPKVNVFRTSSWS